MDKKTLTYLTIFTAIIATGLVIYTLKNSTEKSTPQITTKEPVSTAISLLPKTTPSFTFSPKEPENARVALTPAPSGAVQQPSKTTAKPSAIIRIDINQAKFTPDNTEVAAGDTVIWTNKDTRIHTVAGKSWRTETIKPEKTGNQQFDVPGTYQYYSEEYPTMTGKIIVK